ncbi:hypothetical protein PILCRDRAFT_736976 [Piloderma croceum F 1598]|uniref:DNA replication factor Dna2 N-terminal domain-containing protein n=1 Tax=Piloderma croceum (strain F 1598) TaxID=765440 RepID=A0A0C3EJM8_PILCF|nr:hypothetical protein PILCRDRAFT_736976 [Piloderma croceum F 1598]
MLVHSSSDITPSLVWGNVLHEVMQRCLREGEWGGRWIDEQIERVVRGAGGEGRGMGDLVRLGVGVEEAVKEVKARAGGLKTFGERYMAQSPKATAILTDTRSTHKDPSLLAITNLHDVEEDIWSPTYGLKGKLDATVQACITSPSPPTPFTLSSSTPSTIKTNHPAPLEIKTGRAIAGTEHRAQTLLYTLLASERYATAVPSGLLYYTQSEEVVRVPVGWNEIRGLIGVRNLLAGFVVRRGSARSGRKGKGEVMEEPFLPPTIDDERTCKRCYALDTCMLYRKVSSCLHPSSSETDLVIYAHIGSRERPR